MDPVKPKKHLNMSGYRFAPVHGGGICLIGDVGTNRGIHTTRIVGLQKGRVLTESGTVYELGSMLCGVWEIQLSMSRPKEYAALQEHELI